MKKELMELLIHKELTGDISAAEAVSIQEWRDSSEENTREYEVVRRIWEVSNLEEADLISTNVDAQLNKLMSKVEVKSPKVVEMKPLRKSSFPWMKIAAGFILVLGAVMIIKSFNTNQQRSLVESTSNGEVEAIDMIDGSSVLMNENASVTFFPHIKTERRIGLEGEAFFDVARDESKPFIVETENATIRVLGTSFKVTNSQDNETVVAVRHGKVQVTPKNGGQSVILTKGQKVSLKEEFSAVETFEDHTLTGFEGMLNFDDTRVSKVMQLLELKFGKEISWNSTALAHCEVNGQFEGKSINDIMAILKTALHIENIVFEDTQVTLTGGSCN